MKHLKLRTIYDLVLIISAITLAGCANPERVQQQERVYENEIKANERQAEVYRETQNDGMTDYHENKATEARTSGSNIYRGPVDFFMRLFFKTISKSATKK
ncbi:MAG: hypothetical protein OEX12_04025 [Gammaproteobacteria bacterium]|nr:hypothetical protein [Gammaproteobacteria bacterium]